MSDSPHPYRLRLPGPTEVPEQVRMALSEPVIAHRRSEFAEVLIEASTLAQTVFGTHNKIMVFASSGTGLMEAAIANILGKDDKALILVNGLFGERFMQIATALNLQADTLEVPWGEAVSAEAVAERLRDNDYKAVVAVHNESSTGAVTDLAAIGRVVRETDALLVVDSVSGIGGLDVQQDAWGVDVLITASQKALMCPPGLALASISDKAWKVIDEDRGKARFYWDFRRARDAAAKGQTAYTSPIPLTFALREALRMIHAEGWPNVLARHRQVSAALRAGSERLGLSTFTSAQLVSDTVCVFTLPESLDAKMIVHHMCERYGTVIVSSRIKPLGRVIRIGTMGSCTEQHIATDLLHLEQTFGDLERRAVSGVSVAEPGASALRKS